MATRNQVQELRASDVPPGTCRKGFVNGREIAIFNVGGEFFATQSDCTHAGGPLCEGDLAGDVITCPWHGSQFNVRTGEVIMDPATEPITTFPVTQRDGQIIVDL